MCQFCAASRLTTTILRARTCSALRQAARRTLTTTSIPNAGTKPVQEVQKQMSKGSFLASVATMGGAAGVGAAYVTTPS